MPPRTARLTFAQFVREILDQRTPLLYAFAVIAGAAQAGDTYQAGWGVPDALLVGAVLGVAHLVLLCTAIWFVFRLRGL